MTTSMCTPFTKSDEKERLLTIKTLYKKRPQIVTFCMYVIIIILMICDSRGTANNKEMCFLF